MVKFRKFKSIMFEENEICDIKVAKLLNELNLGMETTFFYTTRLNLIEITRTCSCAMCKPFGIILNQKLTAIFF